MSQSPMLSKGCISEPGIISRAPVVQVTAASTTRRDGFTPKNIDSAIGVNAKHRLMRKAALGALVNETPNVSKKKIQKKMPPRKPPPPSAFRHSRVDASRSEG